MYLGRGLGLGLGLGLGNQDHARERIEQAISFLKRNKTSFDQLLFRVLLLEAREHDVL
jgi:hypothetical protein